MSKWLHERLSQAYTDGVYEFLGAYLANKGAELCLCLEVGVQNLLAELIGLVDFEFVTTIGG